MARDTMRVRNTFGIDTSEFRGFARAMRAASRPLAAEVRKDLREAGELVKQEAEKIVEPHSRKVAESLRVRIVGTSVIVSAGGDNAPLAPLLELGNAGKPGRKTGVGDPNGTFNHPVFGEGKPDNGTDAWVKQAMHPFLWPAAEATRREVEMVLEEAITKALAHVNVRTDN